MKIAVDAMGGDFAPEQIVFGAVRAAKKYGCEIVLVGDEEKIREVLKRETGWEKGARGLCGITPTAVLPVLPR